MNTKKILVQLDDIEELIFQVKEFVEEENWVDAVGTLQQVEKITSSSIGLIDNIEESEVEDE